MKKQHRWLSNAFFISVPLLLGLLVYVLFRPPLPIARKYLAFLHWNNVLIELSFLPVFLSAFIKFHLADILWALSFFAAVFAIKRSFLFSFIVVMCVDILYELAQFTGVVTGTGDWLDVFFVLCSLTIIFFIRTVSKQHEQKN